MRTPKKLHESIVKKVNKITQPSESLISVNRPPVYINIIPESDVYRLVMRSNLPSAERFQDWVCEEVLPSIRKTGGYGTVALPNFSDPVEAARAWADKEEQRRLEEHAKLMALETIEVQKPLVQIAEDLIRLHNEICPDDKQQLSFWDGFPVELKSNGSSLNVLLHTQESYHDCIAYIECSTAELSNPYLYYDRIKEEKKNRKREYTYKADLAMYEKLKAKLRL